MRSLLARVLSTLTPLAPLALLAASVAAWSATPADCPAGAEKIPLYTNDDLERLQPLPQQKDRIAPAPQGEDWDLLFRLIEMDQKRTQADRQERLERERLALVREGLEWPADGGWRRGSGYLFLPGVFGPARPFVPTPRELFLDRLRLPAGQRGVTSAADAFEESRHEFELQRSQPPIGLRR